MMGGGCASRWAYRSIQRGSRGVWRDLQLSFQRLLCGWPLRGWLPFLTGYVNFERSIRRGTG